MKKCVIPLLIFIFLICNPSTYAVKVVFKAKPISKNLMEGPTGVFVYYKIYHDTVTANIEGLIDMPLLKMKDIRNITVKKSDRFLKGIKPKFRTVKKGNDELGLITTQGFIDKDIKQGATYAYILYFNSDEEKSKPTKAYSLNSNEIRISNYIEPTEPGTGGSGGGTTTTTTIPLGNPDIAFSKLNNVFREACHNCFQQNIISLSEGGFLQALAYTRVVELDLHSTFLSNRDGWDTYHSYPSDHNCGGGGSSFNLCLDDLEDFHNQYNDHDPIIVFLDLKTDWTFDENRTTTHLDALLIGKFGDDIYRPSDFQGSNTDMKLLAQKNNWPSYEDLLGKIIFVLGAEANRLNQYQLERGNGAVCFTMAGTFEPDFSELTEILNLNTYKNYNYPDKFVFYNFQLQDGNQSEWNDAATQMTAPLWTSEKGYFTRVWEFKLNLESRKL